MATSRGPATAEPPFKLTSTVSQNGDRLPARMEYVQDGSDGSSPQPWRARPEKEAVHDDGVADCISSDCPAARNPVNPRHAHRLSPSGNN